MQPGNDSGALKVTLGLVFTGLILFGASFNHPFHFDDVLFVNDTNVVNPSRWFHFLNPLYLRQLTYFSFFLNHLLGGNNPVGYHIVNVALHIANAVLLFRLLDRVLNRPTATIAAAIFLVHPVQSEAVLYVYQRSILLACFFSLLALLAWTKQKRWLAALFFLCAFEAKESALVVPLLLAAGYFYSTSTEEEPQANARLKWMLVAGVALLGAASLLLLGHDQEKTVGMGAASQVPPLAYLLTETRVVYTYLRLLVFPRPQSLEYDFSLIRTLNFQVVAGTLGLAVLIGAGVLLARSAKWRVPGLAVPAFFVLLAPTSSIIPSVDLAFEHRLYLPMLAVSVFAASLIALLRRPAWIAIPLLAALSILTIGRESVWATDARLWEDAVQHAPNKARTWFNLGGATLTSEPARAQAALKRALELQPVFPEALYDLGVIEQARGNNRAAYGYFEAAVSQRPEYWSAWNNLGNVLFALGQNDQAITALEHTLSLNPDYWPAQYNIAIVQYASGRFDSALPRLRTVLDWRPDFREARYLLAECLSRTGQPAEAERERLKSGQSAGQSLLPASIPAPTP